MDIILIAATTLDGYIAHHARELITWSEDLPLFKKQTGGYPVIMGMNTYKTLQVELPDRDMIVVRRGDKPQDILDQISSKKCFIIGGGKINSLFAPFITHMYLTPHPLIFGSGIKLFHELNHRLELKFMRKIEVNVQKNISQYQYQVIKQ